MKNWIEVFSEEERQTLVFVRMMPPVNLKEMEHNTDRLQYTPDPNTYSILQSAGMLCVKKAHYKNPETGLSEVTQQVTLEPAGLYASGQIARLLSGLPIDPAPLHGAIKDLKTRRTTKSQRIRQVA